MGLKKLYKDKAAVKKASQKINDLLVPGYVINTSGEAEWYKLHMHIAYAGIRLHQKKTFKDGYYKDTHTTLYMGEGDTFSVEPPKPLYIKTESFCMDRIDIYKYTKRDISSSDMGIITGATDRLVAETKYDIPQLMDIAINGILGYENYNKFSPLDASAQNKVCSVGIAVCFEVLRQARKDEGMQKLFWNLNPKKWSEKDIKKWEAAKKFLVEQKDPIKGYDPSIENVCPADFANSDYYENELEKVASFDHGQRIV